jgi:hypothetical protein
VLQLEHRDSPVGLDLIADELGADHPARLQPEPVLVEGERPLQIGNRERDDVDSGFHPLPGAYVSRTGSRDLERGVVDDYPDSVYRERRAPGSVVPEGTVFNYQLEPDGGCSGSRLYRRHSSSVQMPWFRAFPLARAKS